MTSSSAGKRAVLLLCVLALAGGALMKRQAGTESTGSAFQGYGTEVPAAALEETAGSEAQTQSVPESAENRTTVQTRAEDPRIDINTADPETLKKLPGIGDVKAQAIVSYREAHGPFSAPEKLMLVYGIGKKTYERLKDLIKV